MSFIDSRSLRVGLLVATLLVVATSLMPEESELVALPLLLLLYLPGSFFVPVLMLAHRSHGNIGFYALRLVVFALVVLVASFALVQVSSGFTGQSLLVFPVAGALGAFVTIAAMRVLLGYRLHGIIGWLLPITGGAASQVVAELVGRLFPTFELLWPALFWWWLVGEALIWQQRLAKSRISCGVR